MGTKNTVTADDYTGGRVKLKVKLTKDKEVVIIKPSFVGRKVPIAIQTEYAGLRSAVDLAVSA